MNHHRHLVAALLATFAATGCMSNPGIESDGSGPRSADGETSNEDDVAGVAGHEGMAVEPGMPTGSGWTGGEGPGGMPVPGGIAGGPSVMGVGGSSVPLVSCEPVYEDTWGDSCNLEEECDNGYSYVYCSDVGNDADCWCETPYASMQYTVKGGAGSDSCETVSDLCHDGMAVSTTAPQCQPSWNETWNEGCSAELDCTTAVSVSEDVTASIYDFRSTYCGEYNGTTACECYTNSQWSQLELPSNAMSTGLCTDLVEVCGTAALAPTGPITCAPSSQWADRTSCSADQQCGGSFTWNGQTGTISTNHSTSCSLAADGSWACQCYSTGERFTVNESSSWDACTTASQQCTP